MALQAKHSEIEEVQTRECPKCGETVPDWANKCQFCGAGVSAQGGLAVPQATHRGGSTRYRIRTSVWVTYYVCAAWCILAGVYEAAASWYSFKAPGSAPSLANAHAVMGLNPIALALGGLTALFGLAVFIDSAVIRRGAATVAGIRVILTVLLIGASLFGMLAFGPNPITFWALAAGNVVSSLLLAWAAGPISATAKPIPVIPMMKR